LETERQIIDGANCFCVSDTVAALPAYAGDDVDLVGGREFGEGGGGFAVACSLVSDGSFRFGDFKSEREIF
jgi:hypothetical protein